MQFNFDYHTSLCVPEQLRIIVECKNRLTAGKLDGQWSAAVSNKGKR